MKKLTKNPDQAKKVLTTVKVAKFPALESKEAPHNSGHYSSNPAR